MQGDLEAALTRLADRPTSAVGSGRTDAGVHARGQVAAVDMPVGWSPEKLRRALNALLPADIWVERARRVPDGFHPRYDAVRRTYSYRIGTEPEAASPFHRRWCWPLDARVDRGLLDGAAALLPGERSFVAFAKAGQPERGYVCTVASAEWATWALGLELRLGADRFLHHMVRYLVGTMVDVARRSRPLEDVHRLLSAAPGIETSPPAPPEGLVLERVEYPESALALEADQPLELRSPATA